MSDEKARRASPELKRTVAAETVAGASCSQLADRHNYTHGGMQRLLRSPEVQALIEEQRERVFQASERMYFKLLLASDDLMNDMIDEARVAGPNQFRARQWCLDRILPQKQQGNDNTTVNINVAKELVQEVLTSIGEARRARTINPIHSARDRLIQGRDALPSAPVDFETEDQEESSDSTPQVAGRN